MLKEIDLKVPLISQSKGRDYCNLACVEMISTYFDDPITQEEMESTLMPVIENNNIGITPATARILAKRGFKTTIMTRQTDLMAADVINREFTDVEALRKTVQNHEWSEGSTDQWKEYVAFVEAGGILHTALATLDTIDAALQENIPCRLNIAPKALHPDSVYFAHAVVISGIKDGMYILNDPAERFSEPYTVERNELLYAWYARGATILIASKK